MQASKNITADCVHITVIEGGWSNFFSSLSRKITSGYKSTV